MLSFGFYLHETASLLQSSGTCECKHIWFSELFDSEVHSSDGSLQSWGSRGVVQTLQSSEVGAGGSLLIIGHCAMGGDFGEILSLPFVSISVWVFFLVNDVLEVLRQFLNLLHRTLLCVAVQSVCSWTEENCETCCITNLVWSQGKTFLSELTLL